jgi:hypothetical protein
MNGCRWSGGAPIGLLDLGESTSPQARRNRSLPPFASARIPADRGEVPNSSMAWRRQRSGAWRHSSADPEKRSLRIEANLNSNSNFSAHLFPQSERPVCPRNFHETSTKLPSTKLPVHETSVCPRNFTSTKLHVCAVMVLSSPGCDAAVRRGQVSVSGRSVCSDYSPPFRSPLGSGSPFWGRTEFPFHCCT